MFELLWLQVTDLIQGDTYATIGCVVPSLVALHKCLTGLSKTARYHNGLARSLLESLESRFVGIFANLQMSTKASQTGGHLPYDERIYLLAAALDPNYGYIWLDADHSGNAAVKTAIKHQINGNVHHLKFIVN